MDPLFSIVQRHAALIADVRGLLAREGARHNLQVVATTTSTFRDPEEMTEEVVITQRVAASADVALAYWDNVGQAIQRWTTTLPPDAARAVTDEIAIIVEWR